MKYILNIAYFIALILYSPLLLYRMARQNRYRIGWGNRFGKITRKMPHSPCIWIHAVSVGEVNATKTVVEGLKKSLPDYEIIISTTTDTGFARANALYAKDLCVFFFPFDFSFAVSKAFKNLKPSLCMLMELEVWPNFVKTAKRNGVPVMVINGRLSDKSFPSYNKIRPIIKNIFKDISCVLAQTDEYANRFIALGCDEEKVTVSSSLKYDTAQIADKIEGSEIIAEKLNLSNQTLMVAGGTGPGEEKQILEVYEKLLKDNICENFRLAIVPRKPERFDEVASLIKQSGFELTRFSEYKNEQKKTNSTKSVILVDTMGDLRKFYSLCTIAFVGRSLVPMGGSDMIESAALAKTTIFGEYTFNFKQSVEVLLADNGAIEVKDAEQLYEQVKKCLTQPQYASGIAQNGREVIIKNQGATEKTVQAAAKLLNQH